VLIVDATSGLTDGQDKDKKFVAGSNANAPGRSRPKRSGAATIPIISLSITVTTSNPGGRSTGIPVATLSSK